MFYKIFKKIKFVICFIMIISFVFPIYASLSASDGSVFVTKAESDSAVAKLYSRFDSFESGVNSKIDSQVTSYLDTNSIWNGKEITWQGDTSKNITLADFGGNMAASEERNISVCRFRGKARKAGLAYMVFKMQCIKTAAGNNGWRPYIRQYGGRGWVGYESMMFLSLDAGEYDTSSGSEKENKKYSTIVSTSTQSIAADNPETNGACILLLPQDGAWVAQFFVQKGSDIWIGLNNYRLTTGNQAAVEDTNDDAWRNGKVVVSVEDAFVY